ncbi:MAG: glycosyltransferase 87 family protein [Candidatus Nanopelagicales bacterium]|nr:glycosyltransferase 87 family protein [Candidatus Nanopelagicales bacterium]
MTRLPAAALDWCGWAVLRAALVLIICDVVPWAEQVNDLAIYAGWATGPLAEGRFPDDPMWQYPPLAGPVFRLGEGLPGDRLGFVLLFLAFDAAIMTMLAVQAHRSGRGGGRRLWALLPLVTGPLLLARFDVVPTALAVAAVLLATTRPALAGALAAVGAWLKVWPALVLAGVRRADLPSAIVGALLASAAVGALVALTAQDPFGFLTGQASRGLQLESVAAWPFLAGRMLGADVAVVYQYGAHEVVAPGVPAVASASLVASALLLGLVAVQRLRGVLEAHPAADVALVAVLVSVVTSRVFSGQYFVWLLGLGAVCLAVPGTRLRRTVHLLVAAGVATQLVYPWLYTALLQGAWYAVAVQTVRVALVLLATALALGTVLRPQVPAPEASGASGS